LDDPVMFPAVSEINVVINQLAPVLNSPNILGVVSVESGNVEVPVDIMVKHFEDTLYVFAVSMREGTATVTFTINGIQDGETTVIGEDRELIISNGIFEDQYKDYEVHLYKIPAKHVF
ncbi:MAG: hypothetical protein KAT31_13670, partial [Bacteroidales bacterium]|nr:hypothetical protein [Bacteroidales bacterium]